MQKELSTQDEIDALLNDAKKAILSATTLSDIAQLKVKYLGKKGRVTELLKLLGQLSKEERPLFGKSVNIAKEKIQHLLIEQETLLKAQLLDKKIATEAIDVTLPGRGIGIGALHPVTQVTQRVIDLFEKMGFSVAEGPEIEDDFHNFIALNFEPHHPAKGSHDTFYFPNGKLLRTHTSPVQIRVMKTQTPPLRIITPGKVYRCDSDPTHTPMFHQLEGLVVDEHSTFSDLKGVLQDFFNQFFETKLKLRFRPSYFPFTEPSAEVDIQHMACQGKGCRVCGHSGWLEVLGCGMVHPNVLRNVDIDPEKYQGFAFGLGLDRMAMLRYGIDDLRTLFENDLRFLEQ